jgi:uncharacterized protein (TIGR00106 family)
VRGRAHGEIVGGMLLAFSVTPLGPVSPGRSVPVKSADSGIDASGDPAGDSVGDAVAEAVRIVRESGLPSETNAMFTNIEGEWDEVMAVVKAAVNAVAARSSRVSVVIKADLRSGVTDALHGKVASVEARLREQPPGT